MLQILFNIIKYRFRNVAASVAVREYDNERAAARIPQELLDKHGLERGYGSIIATRTHFAHTDLTGIRNELAAASGRRVWATAEVHSSPFSLIKTTYGFE